MYFDQGDYRSAEALFRRALAIDERRLDAQHPTLATRLVNLAEVGRASRVSTTVRVPTRYTSAPSRSENARWVRVTPQVTTTLIARALLRNAAGNVDGAVDLLSRGAELREEAAVLRG